LRSKRIGLTPLPTSPHFWAPATPLSVPLNLTCYFLQLAQTFWSKNHRSRADPLFSNMPMLNCRHLYLQGKGMLPTFWLIGKDRTG